MAVRLCESEVFAPKDSCDRPHPRQNGCMDGELFKWSQLEEMVTSCDVHWEHFSGRNIKTFPEADGAAETRQSAQEDAVEGK